MTEAQPHDRTLVDMAAPQRTALIVIDFQNDYCSPDGAYGQVGTDLSMMPPVIDRAATVIDAARGAGALVIWLQQTTLRAGRSAAPSSLRSRNRYLARERTLDGTFGHAIVSQLQPRPDEPLIRKLRSSGFVGTMLDQVLTANGIEACVMIGVATEGCVEATARSARDHAYDVVVLRDCVASTRMDLHDCSLTTMASEARYVDASDALAAWRAHAAAAAPARDRTLNGILDPPRTAVLLVESDDGRPDPPAATAVARAAIQAGVPVLRVRAAASPRHDAPGDGETLLTTIRQDAFEGAPLHARLRDLGARTVVIVGADAHRGVESTARGATHRNYHVVCVEDAIQAPRRDVLGAALAIMRQRYEVTTSAALAARWMGE
ncbi:MAG: isochorismatase family protein [Armatimonadetes bacterium]|nr:isochorismatase family protein [Armatimonadota bacterium]